ncbi:MAG: nucleotidyltransferase [Deltaproteobacteria bacterium]|nr:nucleotidyltransferase [Deltaproteobacteria bacterium]
MQHLQSLIEFLVKSPLDFVLIGGFAAVLHGCNQTTRDIDICLAFSPEHLQELRRILAPLHPRHRMTSDKLSFLEHPHDLRRIKNLDLETDLGVLDLVSRVAAVGDFIDVMRHASTIELFGGQCHLMAIDDLIKSKQALGRHRDLVVVEELLAIRNK